MKKSFVIPMLALICSCLFSVALLASDPSDIETEGYFSEQKTSEKKKEAKDVKYDFSFYRGQFTDTDLFNIVINGKTDYMHSFVNVVTFGRPLESKFYGLNLEAEGQFVIHTGIQKHVEYNGLIVFRTDNYFKSLALNFAFGEGLSLASHNPDLENRRRSLFEPFRISEYSKKLLNYLMFEVQFALPFDSFKPRVFFRIHHRSGVFGLFCPPTCGSNFISQGVKFRF